jgi:uncharacterized membrane protein YeaQ/YmgE (transglycosylase-associated protein family)/outer membrane protein OmpA-like peptidoglycan-associated protein
MDMLIGIFALLVLGLIVGALAKFLMPGDDPGGIVLTSILGVVGAILGGWIASFLEIGGITGFDWRSLITAVGGAMVLLLAYRAFRMLTPQAAASSSYVAGRTGIEGSSRPQPLFTERDATDSVTDLMDTAKGAFSANILQKLSETLGENTGAARKAIEAMVPTVLAGMSNQASTVAGAARLFDMAKDAAQGGPDLIGRLESHINTEGLSALSRKGGSVLSALFGDKLNGLMSWFTRFAGVKESSATSLMGIVVNQVLGILGKNIMQKGLTSATFGRMLSSLGGPLSRLLPAGISEVPGMRHLVDAGERAAEYADTAVEAGRRTGEDLRGAYRQTAGAARQGAPWLAAIAPLLLLTLPLLAFAYLMRGAAANLINKAQDIQVNLPQANLSQVKVPDARPAEFAVPAIQPALVATTFVEKLVEVKLPGGKELKLPATSFPNEVYRYLTNATDTKGRAFKFDGLDFDDGTIKTRPETEAAVTQLTTLLEAFPKVTLRIDAHTDRSADADADKRRSLERAETLKGLLVKAGVPSDRIKISDLGSTKPATSDDTAEGHAKNDRIELWLEKS